MNSAIWLYDGSISIEHYKLLKADAVCQYYWNAMAKSVYSSAFEFSINQVLD